MHEVYLTREGHEKLRLELEHLKTVRRRQLAKAIGEARAHGDISENAEYDAAKDAQGHNEARIADLESKLSHVRILDDENIPSDEVLIGATVELEDADTREKITYTLVSAEEADFDQNKISVSSPLGAGLIGHKEGDTAEIAIPAGKVRYKVLKISR
jgi:transcription elongation factor GreA